MKTKPIMKYIERVVSDDDFLVLEPEDWKPWEWRTILKVFGMEKAERIVIKDYKFQAFGIERSKNG